MLFFYKLKRLIASTKNKIIFSNNFGLIKGEVSLFPLFYLFIIYGLGFLNWSFWNEKSIFILWAGQEKLSEYIQFIFYLLASLISLINIFLNNYKLFSVQNIFWIIFLTTTSFICMEEISFLNHIDSDFFELVRESNVQSEVNLHNNKFVQPFLPLVFMLFNFFIGFLGWQIFPKIDALPQKTHSLYFLLTFLAYSIIAFKQLIRHFFPIFHYVIVYQENFEFLMAMGLFLHALKMLKRYSKNLSSIK